ncbi:hypothetical protein LguiB_032207 [Lonicera macranthoides]
MEDKLVWKYTQNGAFSMKLGYQVKILKAVSNSSSPLMSYSIAPEENGNTKYLVSPRGMVLEFLYL